VPNVGLSEAKGREKLSCEQAAPYGRPQAPALTFSATTL